MVAFLTLKRSKVGIVQSEGVACVVRSVGFSRLIRNSNILPRHRENLIGYQSVLACGARRV